MCVEKFFHSLNVYNPYCGLGLAQLPPSGPAGVSAVNVSYHVRKADIGKTLD